MRFSILTLAFTLHCSIAVPLEPNNKESLENPGGRSSSYFLEQFLRASLPALSDIIAPTLIPMFNFWKHSLQKARSAKDVIRISWSSRWLVKWWCMLNALWLTRRSRLNSNLYYVPSICIMLNELTLCDYLWETCCKCPKCVRWAQVGICISDWFWNMILFGNWLFRK